MNWRDIAFLTTGLFIGAFVQALRDHPKEVKGFLESFKFHEGPPRLHLSWDGDDPIKSKRLWPPMHPGGRPTSEKQDEMFELKQSKNLTPKQTWEEYLRRYPEALINPDTGEPLSDEAIKLTKLAFDEAMRNRKRKLGR